MERRKEKCKEELIQVSQNTSEDKCLVQTWLTALDLLEHARALPSLELEPQPSRSRDILAASERLRSLGTRRRQQDMEDLDSLPAVDGEHPTAKDLDENDHELGRVLEQRKRWSENRREPGPASGETEVGRDEFGRVRRVGRVGCRWWGGREEIGGGKGVEDSEVQGEDAGHAAGILFLGLGWCARVE